MKINEKTTDINDKVVLFHATNDPYTNAGIAALTAKLRQDVSSITVDGNRVVVDPEDVKKAFEAMENRFFGNDGVVRYTHRRTSTAQQVNKALDIDDSPENSNFIGQPKEPFPEDETVYDDDEVDDDDLEKLGINEDVDYGGSLYSKSPTYVGAVLGRQLEGTIEKCQEYLNLFRQSILDDSPGNVDESACMSCGRKEIPNWKADDNVVYGQQFTPVTTKAGSQQPLGQKNGQQSWYRGRCVACLVAGFYYVLTPNKPVSPAGNEYRVFVPDAPLERLVDIHTLFDDELLEDITSPTSNGYARRSTIPGERTESEGLQSAKMTEQLVKTFRREESSSGLMSGVEFVTDPVTLRYYTTTDSKSGNPVRGFSSFGRVGDSDWMYEAMEPFDVNDETHWPYDSVFSWFTHLDNQSSDSETLVRAKNDISIGVLEAYPDRIERGMVDVLKGLGRDAEVRYPPSLMQTSNYFTKIFTSMTDNIDKETIESISNVATTLGRQSEGEVSQIIALQNASTPEQFMKALESVGVDAMKKSVTDDTSNGYVWHEDAQDVIEAVTNPDTFNMAKRAFVTQAALAAQYQYSQKNTADTNGDKNE